MEDFSAGEKYDILSNLIVPRPIALISSIGELGPNLAPFSFFAPGGPNPPCLAVCIVRAKDGGKKSTLRNIESSGEFVVNLVTREMDKAMNSTGVDYDGDPSKWEIAGLESMPSIMVQPRRVALSPVHFECLSREIVEFGSSSFVIGEVVMAHVRADLMDEKMKLLRSFEPIARLGGSDYLDLQGGKVFEMTRPSSTAPTSLPIEPNQ